MKISGGAVEAWLGNGAIFEFPALFSAPELKGSIIPSATRDRF
jgi:hypothetical protein